MTSSISRLAIIPGVIAVAGTAVLVWSISTPITPEEILDSQAEQYVVLALGLDTIREGEVDAYFGPPALRQDALNHGLTLDEIAAEGLALRDELLAPQIPELAERQSLLLEKTQQLLAITELLARQQKPAFTEELDLLYGISLPETRPDGQPAIDALENLLPGRGSLAFKLASFQNKLIIPPAKRQAVFEAALAECRQRTASYWNLPAEEQLAIEWTRDVQSAWHEYQGNYHSTMRINALTVALVGSAVDLACHEAYPGHHAQFVMMEQSGSWHLENTVVLLRSPGAVLREGAASAGVALAFSDEERLTFERDVLFPLAGLPADQAAIAFRIHQLVTAVSAAIIPVVQDYYDGIIDYNAASFRLEREAMVTSPVALLDFVNIYGAYSSGYTVVRNMLEDYLDREGGTDSSVRWDIMLSLLVAPPHEALETLQGD